MSVIEQLKSEGLIIVTSELFDDLVRMKERQRRKADVTGWMPTSQAREVLGITSGETLRRYKKKYSIRSKHGYVWAEDVYKAVEKIKRS